MSRTFQFHTLPSQQADCGCIRSSEGKRTGTDDSNWPKGVPHYMLSNISWWKYSRGLFLLLENWLGIGQLVLSNWTENLLARISGTKPSNRLESGDYTMS